MSIYKDLKISDLKRLAKLHAAKSGIKLAKAQNEIAVNAGYSDFTEALRKLSKTKTPTPFVKTIFTVEDLKFPPVGSLAVYAHDIDDAMHDCDFILGVIENLSNSEDAYNIVVLRSAFENEYFKSASAHIKQKILVLTREGLDEAWKQGLTAMKELLGSDTKLKVTLFISQASLCSKEESQSRVAVAAKTNLDRIMNSSQTFPLNLVRDKLTWIDMMPHKSRVSLFVTTKVSILNDTESQIDGGAVLSFAATTIWINLNGKTSVLKDCIE